MSESNKLYVPSQRLPGARSGALTEFDPGTRTLRAGFKIAPQFRSLPVDIILEKDVAVELRDGVTIYIDVFRPVGAERVPVIVAWSPYGKGQGTSLSVMGVFGLVGLSNGIVSGLEKFRAQTLPTGAHRDTRSAIRISVVWWTPKAKACCGIGRKAAIAMT